MLDNQSLHSQEMAVDASTIESQEEESLDSDSQGLNLQTACAGLRLYESVPVFRHSQDSSHHRAAGALAATLITHTPRIETEPFKEYFKHCLR